MIYLNRIYSGKTVPGRWVTKIGFRKLMMNLVVKDEDVLKYLRENDVIKKHTNMGNLALDLDKYLSHSLDFRKIAKVEPLQGINLLKENNLIDNSSNDSSFEEIKIQKAKDSSNKKMFPFEEAVANKNTNNNTNNNNFNEINTFRIKNTNEIHVIKEEGKSEFLLTGMKFNDSKKNFIDFDNEMSPSNELKQSKYLPPLTKRSSYFKNKNIKIGDNFDNEEIKLTENNESIFFLYSYSYSYFIFIFILRK
jgi:hypothetical protein